MTTTQPAPALGRKSLENTYRYGRGMVSILVNGAETGGAFSLWESVQAPGSEPALHVHHGSDETFYILEGKMRFLVGDQVIDAGPGDVVFGPRGIPHTFRIQSPFRQLGAPAASLEFSGEAAPPFESDLPKMIALSKQLQVEIVKDAVDI
jgi:mannose-6-phosphate isomerase-like protein (cupin superfamily)